MKRAGARSVAVDHEVEPGFGPAHRFRHLECGLPHALQRFHSLLAVCIIAEAEDEDVEPAGHRVALGQRLRAQEQEPVPLRHGGLAEPLLARVVPVLVQLRRVRSDHEAGLPAVIRPDRFLLRQLEGRLRDLAGNDLREDALLELPGRGPEPLLLHLLDQLLWAAALPHQRAGAAEGSLRVRGRHRDLQRLFEGEGPQLRPFPVLVQENQAADSHEGCQEGTEQDTLCGPIHRRHDPEGLLVRDGKPHR
mmetsp:Transcript_81772/g.226530  ORF Transcript_81772/g.226530 Transcript_81772/m.226530 type:complete len:249 (-) Transcript_81772:85-831(-)